jgi:molecular chaperone Hsp33
MQDYIVRVLAKEAGLRGLACITTELAQEAGRRHRTSPIATAVLGYGLTAAALLGALLKVQQRVALKVEADGPLAKMVVEADAYGRVRGYVVNPDLPSPPTIGAAEVAQALGQEGLLTVVKDLGLRDLSHGTIALQSGELDRDLAYYLNQSEQVPSLVEIGVATAGDQLVAAGGLLFQLMPGQDAGALRALAENLDDLPLLSTMLADGHKPAEILAQAFQDTEYEILEERPLAFSCSCSRERSRMALKILGQDDILGLIVEGEAVVDCHFCHERYVFDREELGEILDELEREALEGLFDDEEI